MWEELLGNPAHIWLIAGLLLIVIEVSIAPGLGFFFAGLAAILVGVLVRMEVVAVENLLAQFAWFFAFTVVIAAALWKQLQRWRTNPKAKGDYKNMVGDIAIVARDGLKRSSGGNVNWSGTTMRAELHAEAGVDELAEGAVVEVVEVEGNTLIVKPKA